MPTTPVTAADLQALRLPEARRLRVIRRFALWCAWRAVEIANDPGERVHRAAWLCLFRAERYLEHPTPAALAKLERTRRGTWNAYVYDATDADVSATTVATAYAVDAAASRLPAETRADQWATLERLALEELAAGALGQDWRPDHSVPEDHHAA